MVRLKFELRRLGHWIAQRSVLVIAILIIAVGGLLFWFLLTGPSPNDRQLPLAIAAVTTFFAAISAVANLLQAVEIQKERIEAQRPYVLFNFEGTSRGAIYFKIENLGNSPAKDVRFEFNPAPLDHADRPLDDISLFANPISFLPPGKQIRQIIDAGHRFFKGENPTRFEITVRYFSVHGAAYSEKITHDLEYMKQATIPSKTTEDSLEDMSEELKDIKQILKRVTGSKSLRVESRTSYFERLSTARETNEQASLWSGLLEWVRNFRP